MIKEESYKLLEVLEKDDYVKLNKLFKDKKFNKEFIAYLNGKKLFSVLKKCSNQYLTIFTNEFRDRYNHTNLKMFFPNDNDCIKPLSISIEEFLKKENIPVLRRFLWNELLIVFKKASVSLESDE